MPPDLMRLERVHRVVVDGALDLADDVRTGGESGERENVDVTDVVRAGRKRR